MGNFLSFNLNSLIKFSINFFDPLFLLLIPSSRICFIMLSSVVFAVEIDFAGES